MSSGANKLASDIKNYNLVGDAAQTWMAGEHWVGWMRLGMKVHVPDLNLTTKAISDQDILAAQGNADDVAALNDELVRVWGVWKGL